MHKYLTIGLCVALVSLSGANVWAGKADDTIKACRAAIAEAEGLDYSDVFLKKIKPRGNSYEAWFNAGDDDNPLKSYCYMKRGKIEQLVTTEGRWTGSNPKRPKIEEAPQTELAKSS